MIAVNSATQRLPRVGPTLARVAIVLGVLGLALALGMGRPVLQWLPISPRILLAGAAAAMAAGLTLVRIEYGILLLPVIAVAVPFAIGTGTESRLVASLLFAGFLLGAWVGQMLIRRRLVVLSSPVNLPLLAFTITAVLSTVHSNAVRPPLVSVWPTFDRVQLGGLGVLLMSAATLVVVMNSIGQLRWIRWLTWIFLAMGAATVVGYLLQAGTDLPGVSVGGLFSLWVVALALGQALFNPELPRWARAGLVALAAAWVFRRFVFETSWLSGWAPAYVAILTIALLRSRYLFLLAVLAGVVGGLLTYQQIYDTQVVGPESAGNFLRLDLWRQNLDVTRDHLLLGTGPAGYAPYYMTFFPDHAMSSHSNYLDVFAQTGLVGSFLFVWFLAALFRVAIDVRKRWPAGFGAGFANGALGGLVGLVVAMALGDWLIPFVYNQTIAGFRYTVHSWIFLGALASMQRLESELGARS